MSEPTILLVDDELPIRESLGRLMARAGWHVTTASSCAEARAMLRSAPADAVVLDVRMPDGGDGMASGLELLASIRQEPALRRIPVIVLTGYFLSAEEDAFVRRHGAAVLYKPADVRTIAARLSSLRAAAADGTASWAG